MALKPTARRTLERRIKNRKLPNVDPPTTEDSSLNSTLHAIQDHLLLYEGNVSAPKERFVSLEELEAAGIVDLTVQRGFASITGYLGKPVQVVKSESASTIPDALPAAGSAISTPRVWRDLRDVNDSSRHRYSVPYFDGSNWRAATELLWNPEDDFLQLANAHSINWLNNVGSTTELINFEPAIGSGIEVDHFSNSVSVAATTGDETQFVTLHTLMSAGQLIAGDKYLMVAKTYFGCDSETSRDDPADVGIRFVYGGNSWGISTTERDFDAGVNGEEFAVSKIVTADAISDFVFQARAAGGVGDEVEAIYSQFWCINLTQLTASNYIEEAVAGAGDTSAAEDVWVDAPQTYTIGDGESDYILFLNCAQVGSHNVGESNPGFEIIGRVNGGPWTDAELWQRDDRGAHIHEGDAAQYTGMLMMEAPAANTELQFSFKWKSDLGFDDTHGSLSMTISIIALRLNDFADYTLVTTADATDIPNAAEAELLTASFTAAAGATSDWAFLGNLSSFFASSGDDARSVVRADINSAGDADVSGTQAVTADGEQVDRMLQAIIPIGTETSLSDSDTVDFGLFVDPPPDVASSTQGAAGLVAFSYLVTPTQDNFILGDPAYPTEIDGEFIDLNADTDVFGSLTIWDSGETDNIEINHDGADVNVVLTNTANMNFSGATGAYVFDAPVHAADGSAAGPAYSFSLDPDTGRFRPGDDKLSDVAGGIEGWRIAEASSQVISYMGLHSALSASTTQTQAGATGLLSSANAVGTVANQDDTVRLHSADAESGLLPLAAVVNYGANRLQIFPPSGETIDEHAADEPVFLDPERATLFVGVEGTGRWNQIQPNDTLRFVLVDTSTHTVLYHEDVVLVDDDAALGAVTITLPPAAAVTGKVRHIKKIGATDTVTVDGDGAETIDGSATFLLLLQFNSVSLYSDGTEWHVI